MQVKRRNGCEIDQRTYMGDKTYMASQATNLLIFEKCRTSVAKMGLERRPSYRQRSYKMDSHWTDLEIGGLNRLYSGSIFCISWFEITRSRYKVSSRSIDSSLPSKLDSPWRGQHCSFHYVLLWKDTASLDSSYVHMFHNSSSVISMLDLAFVVSLNHTNEFVGAELNAWIV